MRTAARSLHVTFLVGFLALLVGLFAAIRHARPPQDPSKPSRQSGLATVQKNGPDSAAPLTASRPDARTAIRRWDAVSRKGDAISYRAQKYGVTFSPKGVDFKAASTDPFVRRPRLE